MLTSIHSCAGRYVKMWPIKSKKRLEYCSGFTVEISAPAWAGWEKRKSGTVRTTWSAPTAASTAAEYETFKPVQPPLVTQSILDMGLDNQALKNLGVKMRQSLRKNRGWCHIHCDCCHQKKKQTQPRLRCSHQMWHLWPPAATGTTLLFLRRADGRCLEKDTNSNVWPKGNSDDKDTRAVFIFQDQSKLLGAQK